MATLNDVRDYLRKQLAELADSDATSEEMDGRIKRANATVSVANAIVSTVKAEIDAVRVMADTGLLPASIEAPTATRPELRAIEGKRRA